MVVPVRWHEQGEDGWWMALRCGACGAREARVVGNAEATRFGERLDAGMAEIAAAADRIDRERLGEQAAAFAAALARDLIDAGDFGPRWPRDACTSTHRPATDGGGTEQARDTASHRRRKLVPAKPSSRLGPDTPAREREAYGPRTPDPTLGGGYGPPAGPPPERDWRSDVATASGLNAIAGIWLIIAPFVLGYRTGDPYWNDIVFGAVILVLGVVRATGAYRESWLSWLNALAGAWIFVSAFWLDNSSQAIWNDLIAGAVVVILALLSATASEDAEAWYRR